MLQCDWARDGQYGTLNQVQLEAQSIRYAKFYLSEYLGSDKMMENFIYPNICMQLG